MRAVCATHLPLQFITLIIAEKSAKYEGRHYVSLCDRVKWPQLANNGVQWRGFVNMVMVF